MPGTTDIYIISGPSKSKASVGSTVLGPVVWLTMANGQPIMMPQELYDAIMVSYGSNRRKASVGAFTITADSAPVLDGWGWEDYWGCADWVLWHQLNVTAYGKEAANQKFIEAWGSQSSDMHPYNWCKYDAGFANYFSQQGVDVGWLLSHLVVAAQTIPDAVINDAGQLTDAAGNVLNSAEAAAQALANAAANVGGGVNNIATVFKYVAPVAAVVGGLWAVNKWVYPIFGKKKVA